MHEYLPHAGVVHEVRQLRRHVAGLLGEFAGGGLGERLARVNAAAGQLRQHALGPPGDTTAPFSGSERSWESVRVGFQVQGREGVEQLAFLVTEVGLHDRAEPVQVTLQFVWRGRRGERVTELGE